MSGGFRTVGRSGLVVSELALGTAAFGSRNRIPGGQADVDAIAATALDLGVTLFDTAESYGDERGVSESLLGHALAGRREEAVISAKFSATAVRPGRRPGVRTAPAATSGWRSRGHCAGSAPTGSTCTRSTSLTPSPRSRRRWRCWTSWSGKERCATPAARTSPAGRSRRPSAPARARGYQRFAATTNEYSLLWRKAEEEVLPAVTAFGLGFLAYFPLQNGLLTGKYTRDQAPASGKVTRFKPHLLERVRGPAWTSWLSSRPSGT